MFMDGGIFTFMGRTGQGKPYNGGSKTVASLTTNSFGTAGTAHFSRWHYTGSQDVARLIAQGKTLDFVCDV
jgi:hypothetical protein